MSRGINSAPWEPPYPVGEKPEVRRIRNIFSGSVKAISPELLDVSLSVEARLEVEQSVENFIANYQVPESTDSI